MDEGVIRDPGPGPLSLESLLEMLTYQAKLQGTTLERLLEELARKPGPEPQRGGPFGR